MTTEKERKSQRIEELAKALQDLETVSEEDVSTSETGVDVWVPEELEDDAVEIAESLDFQESGGVHNQLSGLVNLQFDYPGAEAIEQDQDDTLPTEWGAEDGEVANGKFSLTEGHAHDLCLWYGNSEPDLSGDWDAGRDLTEPEAIDLAVHLLQAVSAQEGGADPVSLLENKLKHHQETADIQPGRPGQAYHSGKAEALGDALDKLSTTPLHNHPDEAEVSYSEEGQ